jgi:MerR family transcriptional regulator/heat shock protein HspR
MKMVRKKDTGPYLEFARAMVNGLALLETAPVRGLNIDAPVFSVGQASQLVTIHAQTLRDYDRMDLIVPKRTLGGARRYSLRDIHRLILTQHMSQDESINLAGITRILWLMEENRQLRREIARMRKPRKSSVFAAGPNGEVTEFMHEGDKAQDSWRRFLYDADTLEISAADSVADMQLKVRLIEARARRILEIESSVR